MAADFTCLLSSLQTFAEPKVHDQVNYMTASWMLKIYAFYKKNKAKKYKIRFLVVALFCKKVLAVIALSRF